MRTSLPLTLTLTPYLHLAGLLLLLSQLAEGASTRLGVGDLVLGDDKPRDPAVFSRPASETGVCAGHFQAYLVTDAAGRKHAPNPFAYVAPSGQLALSGEEVEAEEEGYFIVTRAPSEPDDAFLIMRSNMNPERNGATFTHCGLNQANVFECGDSDVIVDSKTQWVQHKYMAVRSGNSFIWRWTTGQPNPHQSNSLQSITPSETGEFMVKCVSPVK
ncbi:MAG: hypothetical protein M1829_002678 [Trizodia sp. TS-e1964]|nr:MAG: hypothetical protein M1829_002678 [Trizodia sp. TS-e1964]